MSDTHLTPASHGIAIPLLKDQSIKIINTHGTQVLDFWALGPSLSSSTTITPSYQYLSMEHTRAALRKIIPEVGDVLRTNERKEMLTIMEDTSPGCHDTLIAACDRFRYEQLGAIGYHRSCVDNFVEAVKGNGSIPVPAFHPAPLNLFMNVPVEGKTISFAALAGQGTPGEFIILKAEMDLLVVLSACPMDVAGLVNAEPADAHYEII